jgi:hypothetical protein
LALRYLHPFLLPILLVVAAGGAPRPAIGETVPATAAIRDFMIQDVCLDASGVPLLGRSPIDDGAACTSHRDLRPGERLPYHKHDHPSPDQLAAVSQGYQRHDSFPVETAGLGTVVEHSFDFGAGEGRRFGVFDTNGDGGDIAILSPGTVSIGVTEDGGSGFGGFGLWVGQCHGQVTAAALTHSWIVAEFDPDGRGPLQGETVAHLNGLPVGRQDTCPARFNAAFTTWRVVPFRYRAAPGQGAPITLTTLISEHYGGGERATADHVERFYFTRELGGTRWERWQNTVGNAGLSAAKVAETATWFAGTGRCSAPEMPAGGATFLLVDCREWTRIVPPVDPAGDPPSFFVTAIRTRPDAPAFLAPPAK